VDVTGRQAALGLAALALLVALARRTTLDEPLERDLTTYALIGRELCAGRALYSDLWDHKPPAIHLSYAAATALVSSDRAAAYLLHVALGAITLSGVYAVAIAGGALPATGLVAAAIFALLCGNLALQANQPNVESFLNPAITWAVALLLAPPADGRSRRALAAAALLALATLYKPNALAVAAALAAACIAAAAPAWRARALAEAGAILGVIAAVWGLVYAWFAATDRADAFVAAVFTYNRAYGGSVGWNLLRGLDPPRLLPATALAVLPLVGVALLGLPRLLPRLWPPDRHLAIVLAWAAGTYAAVAAPGRFYPHYYQLWLPLLAVAAARAMAGRPPVANVLVVALVALVQVQSYRLNGGQWSLAKYGPAFLEVEAAGMQARSLLAPGETLWSGESGVYLAAGERPASGIVYDLPLREGPLVAELMARLRADLAPHPPELLVVTTRPAPPAGGALARWIDESYVPIEDPASRYLTLTLFARRGGALERRLAAAASPP
jgi:hypothetical protein